MGMRIVSGHPWTIDGRWVVVASEGHQDDCLACTLLDAACEYHAGERIVYDPDNGVGCNPDNATIAFMDLRDCRDFMRVQ